jgi:hypothetical protein
MGMSHVEVKGRDRIHGNVQREQFRLQITWLLKRPSVDGLDAQEGQASYPKDQRLGQRFVKAFTEEWS